MKLEMTERDKKLLVMLSLFVIVVGIGYWGVFAVFKDIRSMNTEIEKQEDIRDENELKLMQIALLEADNETLEEDIIDARKQYYPMMDSAALDRYITDMILSCELSAYDLNISISQKETELKRYQYAAEPEEDEEDAQSASGQYVNFDEEPSTGIYTATLDLRLGGETEKLRKFLNDLLNTDRKLRVVNYSWKNERSVEYLKPESDDELGEYVVVPRQSLSLRLEMYMCEE